MTDKVEIAWAGSFYDDPAALVWTDVTSRAFPGVSAALGRDSDLASTPQARRMSVRLKSYDGALTPGNTASPYYPNVVSGVPIRTSKQDAAGVWHPVWYGLTDTFNPTLQGDVADYTVVDVQCVSAWAALTQAGSRRTYADRVVGDLAPAKGEVWASGMVDYAKSTALFVAGGVIYPAAAQYNTGAGLAWPNAYEPAADLQRWGFAWLKLLGTGVKAWATPGAACPVAETGGSDGSGMNAAGALNGGFASDRPGGQFVVRGDGTSGISAHVGVQSTNLTKAQSNFSRAQVFVGRPPTQLAPVSVSEPVDASGWSATGGTISLVAASTLAHLPRSTAYDPTTGVTATAAIDGPANAMSWVTPAGGNTLRSALIPVTAGVSYGPILFVSGTVTSVSIEWINASSGIISATVVPGTAPLFGRGVAGLLAPALAVNAKVKIVVAGATTVTVGCVGLYEAEALGAATIGVSRWWAAGADAKIWAWVQWPDLLTGGMTTGTAGQIRWLHVAIDVTTWDDAALHMIGWNGYPGVDGLPVVWADGVRVTTGWSASWPGLNIGNDVTHAALPTYDGSAMAGGFGTALNSSPAARATTVDPSALSVPAALLGAARYEVTPDDTMIGRAYSFFGGRRSLSTTYAADTGAQMTRTLDQLGWPDALRDITAGASDLATTWTDGGGLSDYSALISDLTRAEYGWVDIGPDGSLVWLPRAWYGTGTAVAVAHYTWRTPAVGQTAYVPPLDVRWDDKDTYNLIVVGNGIDTMTRSRHDIAGQERGLRKLTVTLPGGASQANIDAVADILAVVHAAGPRIESLTLKAFGPDDPMLAHILARRTGDVVLVDLPQLPAADLSVPMLVTSIEHSSDGIVWSTRLGLGVCPIPAAMP